MLLEMMVQDHCSNSKEQFLSIYRVDWFKFLILQSIDAVQKGLALLDTVSEALFKKILVGQENVVVKGLHSSLSLRRDFPLTLSEEPLRVENAVIVLPNPAVLFGNETMKAEKHIDAKVRFKKTTIIHN